MLEELSFTTLFLAIYALECALWVPQGDLAFIRPLFGDFRLAGPGLHLKSVVPGGAALVFTPPARWRAAPPDKRGRADLRRRIGAFRAEAPVLYWPGRVLLASVAALAWLTHLDLGPAGRLACLGLVLLALGCHVGAVLLLAWRWKRVRLDGRAKALAIVAVSPWASSRAADPLGRGLLDGVHPAAAAQLLLNKAQARDFAADCLRRAVHPLPGEAADATAWGEWVRSRGWTQRDLLAPPEPQAHSRGYCPRCLAQYASERMDCSDCGLPLRGFGRPAG
ncbi:MAG TPA: hypothetical protein VNZ54_04860 [bacterium]|nr:hypothetical protein [bacterium]